ncbi:MAG: outer membrane beta-barrel protein [Prolixibacteraceae bacterium]|nr:outer membrane beta-barrel protein [Prolixibacteraceae bacterium]
MKKLLLAFLTFLIFIPVYSQEKAQWGITYLGGSNDMFMISDLVGAPSYKGDGFFAVGFQYLRPVKKHLSFETGLQFSQDKISIHPNLPPNSQGTISHAKVSMISIPLALRLSFLKYAFINGGLLLDADTGISNPVDNQTGIGALLGAGLQYEFKQGLVISTSPTTQIHSLLTFSSDGNHHRLIQSGLKFGIAYRF